MAANAVEVTVNSSGDAALTNMGRVVLHPTGVTPGSVGDGGNVPVLMVGAKGRILAATTVPVTAVDANTVIHNKVFGS